MEFIRRVRVKDFRSLADVTLDQLGDIAPLAGRNGSGKSNVFRALNLFFNGRIEEDEPLVLRRDFREPGRRKKMEIKIEVDLSLGTGLRQELKDAVDRLADGDTNVTIRKVYSLNPVTDLVDVRVLINGTGASLQPVPDSDVGVIDRLLGLVRFRYVPNHIHPSELLAREEDNIRKLLFARLGGASGLAEDQIALIRQKALELMKPVTEVMSSSTGEVRDVELGTPDAWKDLVWAFGLKLQAGQSNPYEAVLHGSGVQSVLAYTLLELVDTSLRGTLGWRRGAIWAIEEPESFLHASLQASLAARFLEKADGDRLQILLTTHAPAFLGIASEGFAVEMSVTGRTSVEKVPRSDLLRVAQRSGVAPFAHPLHLGPPKPLLLVEGKDDRELLTRAYLASPEPSPYEILALDDLEPALSGGVDQIKTYLHHNRAAMAARPLSSPLIVLLDWEVADGKLNEFEPIFKEHATSRCIRMPTSSRNSELSNDFVGIEAFLSTEFFEVTAADVGLQLDTPAVGSHSTYKYSVNRQNLKAAKSSIHRLLGERANPDDLQPLIDLIPWINSHTTASDQLAMSL